MTRAALLFVRTLLLPSLLSHFSCFMRRTRPKAIRDRTSSTYLPRGAPSYARAALRRRIPAPYSLTTLTRRAQRRSYLEPTHETIHRNTKWKVVGSWNGAAEQGHVNPQYNLGVFYRDVVSKGGRPRACHSALQPRSHVSRRSRRAPRLREGLCVVS